MEALVIREKILAGQPVTDLAFDALLGPRARNCAPMYWSRVEVARQAARWLGADCRRVLDVGSGAGKFCSIAALTLNREVWGLERRADLVAESRALARRLGAAVVIIEGTLETIEPEVSTFDGLFFFNPFVDYVMDEGNRYDQTFARSADAYIADVRRVERWLRAAPVGAAMVTYNGLGGRIPLSWEVKRSSLVNAHTLRLWVKQREDWSADAVVEVEDQLVLASRISSAARQDTRNSLAARIANPELE